MSYESGKPPRSTVGQPIEIIGVIRYTDQEGGFYTIHGRDGATYDPTNLPPAFRKDGLEVQVVARRRDDLSGTHQAGPIVQIERIRAR